MSRGVFGCIYGVYTCITGIYRCIYGNKGCIKVYKGVSNMMDPYSARPVNACISAKKAPPVVAVAMV